MAQARRAVALARNYGAGEKKQREIASEKLGVSLCTITDAYAKRLGIR